MKATKYLTGIAILIVISTTSCKKSFFTDANNNPNAPNSVTLATLLSPVEVNIAYTQGGDMSRFTSMLTQQTIGFSRQSQGYYNYVFSGQDFDTEWGNLYSSTMNNDKALMTQADATGNNEYSGIARLLMAYTLALTVDEWGNVPYSTAFQGLTDIHPSYDNASDLYAVIQGLITDAEADLSNPDDLGTLTPTADDIIYGHLFDPSDPQTPVLIAEQWTKFAHALQARLDYHMTKIDASNATSALNEIALAFGANEDNAQVMFGSDQTSSNPWYQFNQQREDISFAPFPNFGLPPSTLFTEMETSHDPRTGAYFDSTFSKVQGDGESPYYMDVNSPVEFITYDELLFTKTQCELLTGDVTDAQTDYVAAITANMQKVGVAQPDIDAYMVVHGTLPVDADAAKAQVAFEQWKALYLNPEAWSVYRVTNSSFLVPTAGTNGIPTRFLYPNTEFTYNKNADNSSATLYSPNVFWDN